MTDEARRQQLILEVERQALAFNALAQSAQTLVVETGKWIEVATAGPLASAVRDRNLNKLAKDQATIEQWRIDVGSLVDETGREALRRDSADELERRRSNLAYRSSQLRRIIEHWDSVRGRLETTCRRADTS